MNINKYQKIHNLRNCKTKEDFILALFKKFQIECPESILNDTNTQNRFLSRVNVPIYKAENLKTAATKSMRAEQRKLKKLRERGGVNSSGVDVSTYINNQKTKVLDTDWNALSLFFNKNEDELKVICSMNGRDFYRTKEWQSLRYISIKNRGNKCECCGRGPDNGLSIHVDHILPRSIYTEHALNPLNMQILCADCNLAKSNIDCTDWR